MQKMSTEFFISYKREPASAKLANELKKRVQEQFPWLKVNIDETEVPTGGSIRKYMDRLTQGNYIVFLLSPGSLESSWCMYELALTADYEDFKQRVFHIRFPGVKIDTALDVTDITKHWQVHYLKLKANLDQIASVSQTHLTKEFENELHIAGEIVKGSGKALLHMRETKGIKSDESGTIDWGELDRFLKVWIKFPAPIQKLMDNMVLVEGGSFERGVKGFLKNEDQKPPHIVNLSGFKIYKYPVTNDQWTFIMRKPTESKPGQEEFPVVKVSWDDCNEFIARLNDYSKCRFRLPTEAEWEYAARGGNLSRGYKFAGSDKISEVGWLDSQKSFRVGEKKPNEIGLYDMTGLVWQWCSDWYSENFYTTLSTREANANPQGPESGKERALRGGSSFNVQNDNCLVGYRNNQKPDYKAKDVGFRLVLEID